MTRRPLLLTACAALALVGLRAWAAAPVLTYNPGHYQNNDPVWDLLNLAQVTADTRRGEYTAKFPAALIARQDKPFKASGFILPLEASSQSAHFMLVRRNTGCPFCPPNAPTEAIEIFATAPVSYTGDEVAVTGRLKLVSSSAEGLFYRLDGSEVSRTGH